MTSLQSRCCNSDLALPLMANLFIFGVRAAVLVRFAINMYDFAHVEKHH